MFRPIPAIRVDTGHSASRRAPFRYRGSAGPRTFEISTFDGRKKSTDPRGSSASVSPRANVSTAYA